MAPNTLKRLGCVLVLLFSVKAAFGQTVTTGNLSGVVVDQQGAVLPGANVTAVHQPTNTSYETTTAGDGRYQILNVRVGGPYAITASLSADRVCNGIGVDGVVVVAVGAAVVEQVRPHGRLAGQRDPVRCQQNLLELHHGCRASVPRARRA